MCSDVLDKRAVSDVWATGQGTCVGDADSGVTAA